MPEDASPQAVAWYRTRIDPKILKALHERSDWLGLLQTLCYLGLLCITGAAAFLAMGRLPWPAVAMLIYLHGVGYSFMGNGIHELAHGTVFKTKFLNSLFARIFSFLCWFNLDVMEASHARHHRYTLHPPDDLEIVLPIRMMAKQFFLQGFVNYGKAFKVIKDTSRYACGRFAGQWELTLFPPGKPEERRLPINWARTMIVGHAAIIALSIHFRLWLIPVLVTFANFYGGCLRFLCNESQHIGLQDNVPDFRLCCRTIILNPLVRFLYWHMNYHTEHHMYAAVPCYRLGRVHALIKHDLPPCPRGLVATWRQIAAIQGEQDKNPAYQYIAPLPSRSANAADAVEAISAV